MADPLPAHARLRRAEGLYATALDGEEVLMSLERGCYYGLEGPARRIWQLLETPRSLEEVCRELERAFEVDPETCRRDVLAFVSQMRVEHLIEVE